MDRIQLKTNAKAAMAQANPHPALVTLVYIVILFAIQMIVSWINGISGFFSALAYDNYAAAAISAGMVVPLLLLSLIVSLVNSFLELGYVGYTLRVINRHPAGISDLFAYARFFLKAWGLQIVMSIFVGLWTLLFFIPGIIAMYRYSLATYILAENPEKGILECINESKALMSGHKMDKFILDLSFIPWFLLTGITCGIMAVYVAPYKGITDAAFYNYVKYGPGYQQGYGYQQGGYQQNGYQQGGYQQGGFQQNGYQQNGYQQNGYQQGGFQQNGYQQGGFQQNGYQQDGFQQNGYQQNGYQQDGFQQNGYQQNGFQQGGFQQNGFQKNGNQQNGYQQGDFQQNGHQQDGFQQSGFQQNGFQQGDFQQNGYQQDGGQQNDYQPSGFQQQGTYQRDDQPNGRPQDDQQ